MRHIYELTDQTRKVFSGNVARIADEANVSDKYIHGILAGTETDPFAPFEHYFAAAVRSASPVCHWEQRLAAIRSRYEKSEPSQTPFECLAAKIETDATTANKMVNALADGDIDAAEADRILQAVYAERQVLDLIEIKLQFLAEPMNGNGVRSFARKAVSRRQGQTA